MSTKMPRDSYGHVIPCVKLKSDKAHTISVSSSSNTNSVAFEAETNVISFYATVNVFIKFGYSDSVVADSGDHFFPSGVYYNFSLNDKDINKKYTHVAIIRASEDGTVYISECE